ncbi:MAG: SH3 domain-containing protein, partial [Parachlamydiaceae bacterium]
MNKLYLSSLLFVIPFLFSSPNYANDHTFFESPSHDHSKQPSDHEVEILTQPLQSIEPFTGKITRNKVRMRLQPSLDALILRELSKDDLLSVVGESNEFYAILPPKDTKAYIFRTYVLDDIVEGSRVNVRLEPAIEAPVIAQLNSGDKVEGIISPLSS